MNAGLALLRRDLTLAARRRGEAMLPLAFFALVVLLLTLGMNGEPQLLRSSAGGVVWVAALLATLLSLEALFRSDFDDGALEQLALSPQPLPLLVLAKVAAHWLVSGLPLLLVAPLLGLALGLPGRALAVLEAVLALGTPALSLVGAIGVALTVGLRRGGMLLALLVLPLYVPVLVFGSTAVGASLDGLPVAGVLDLLAAYLLLALSLAPWATAAALRLSLA